MTFDELKATVKGYCNLTQPESDTRVGQAINRHHKRVTSKLGMDATRFVTRSVSMTVGVRTVQFTNIEKIDRIIDTTDSTAIRELREHDVDELRTSQPGTGAPCQWAPQNVTASSVTVLTDTVPQTAYSLQADGWAAMDALTGNDEPAFAESYHDILTWYVIAEELLKKEKADLSDRYQKRADDLLSELVFHYADSYSRSTVQGRRSSTATSGSSSGSGGALGATAYTQSALLTFDRGAGLAPFAVAQATAAVVTNLDADKLDGQEGTTYLDRANHTGTQPYSTLDTVTTDRLLGRDTTGTGAVELLSLDDTLEFNAGSVQRAALTGDVTAPAGSNATTIANDAVTYAKQQNVSAASRLIGRGSASGAGDPEELTPGTGIDINTTTVTASALRTPNGATTALAVDSTGAITSATQPRCVAYDASTQSVTAGNTTVLELDSEDVDVGTMHDLVTNNSRVVAPVAGLFDAIGFSNASFSNATPALHLRKNGTTTLRRQNSIGSSGSVEEGLTVVWRGVLAANDYLEVLGQATTNNVTFGSATRALATELVLIKVA